MKTRLRVHLIGNQILEKEALAGDLRTAVIKRRGRMDFVIVPSMVDKVKENFPREDIAYFLALESAYLQFESARDTKAKHIVFVDSIVDRFLRMQRAGVDLSLYFMPRIQDLRDAAGHLFIYGPQFDGARSAFVAEHRIPAQMWSGKDECLNDLVEAVDVVLGGRRERR